MITGLFLNDARNDRSSRTDWYEELTIQLDHTDNHRHAVFLPYLHEWEARTAKFDEAKRCSMYLPVTVQRHVLTLSILSTHELLYLKILVTALTAFSVAVLFSTDRLSGALISANKGGKASAHARA
jgi:hypothetical protein